MHIMNQSESDVQAAIIEALVYDGYLVLRINQGAARASPIIVDDGVSITQTKNRYVRFAFWQALGKPATDKGISDILAVKWFATHTNLNEFDHRPIPRFLAIEVKAPGRKNKAGAVTAPQMSFLQAVNDHGGIAIVADCLEDVAPYLDKVEIQ